MPDREKVISGLEHCIPDPNKSLHERMEENECRHAECPYGGKEYERGMGCFWDLMSDALALLKEQEERIKKRDELLEKAYEEIKWLRGMLKEQEAVQPNNVRKSSSYVYSSQLIGYCKKCGTKINSIDNCSACGKCGQAVKWE